MTLRAPPLFEQRVIVVESGAKEWPHGPQNAKSCILWSSCL